MMVVLPRMKQVVRMPGIETTLTKMRRGKYDDSMDWSKENLMLPGTEPKREKNEPSESLSETIIKMRRGE